jgi:hypothetical protein
VASALQPAGTVIRVVYVALSAGTSLFGYQPLAPVGWPSATAPVSGSEIHPSRRDVVGGTGRCVPP